MSACSAAWTAPITWPGSTPASTRTSRGIGVPARARRQLPGREVERHDLEDLVGRGATPLVRDEVVLHAHRAEVGLAATDRGRLFRRHHRDVGRLARLRVLVGVVGRFEDGDVVVGVEIRDPVLATLVEVDRAGVGHVEGACGVDRPHDPPVGVDEVELQRRAAPQADAGGGRLAPGPEHALAPRLQQVVEHEVAHGVVERVTEVALVGMRERQLVGGARDLGTRHERVVGVDHRRLRRTAEELARVAGVPLVELVVAGDEHGRGAPAGAPGPPHLLAHRRERAREAVEHHCVERADVDPELQRAGGDHAAELAAGELLLEVASLGRQVAGAVRGDRRRARGLLGQEPAGVGGHELGALAAARERERLVTVGDEPRQQHGGLDVGRGATCPCGRRPAGAATPRSCVRPAAIRRRRSRRRADRRAATRARPGCRWSRW